MSTVYSTTLTAATSANSGALAVTSYRRLWIALNITSVAWFGSTTITVSRLDAFDVLFPIASVQPGEGLTSMEIGEGLSIDVAFGDRVHLDVVAADGTTVSGTISVIGK